MQTFYNDIEPYAAQWLRNLIKAGHISEGIVDETPIQKIESAKLAEFRRVHFFAGIGGWDYALKLAGWPEDWPVWTGSCPCQPFSGAGQQKGEADERHLWPDFRNHIDQQRPAIVFGEQVASKLGRAWLSGIRTDLEAMGYQVGAADLCAAGISAPHIRQRLFWMAYAPRERLQRLDPRSRKAPQEAPADQRFGQSTGHGEAGWMGSPIQQGLERHPRNEDRRDKPGRIEAQEAGSVTEAGPISYADFDILHCTDGKARRIEPGTFPLVDGLSFKLGSGQPYEGKSRTGLFKGYGNAINPVLAKVFIESAIEFIEQQ